MYFDPLTSWIVALLADGFILSNGHISDAKVVQYYKGRVKESNNWLNSEIRQRLTSEHYDVDTEIRKITCSLEHYKNRYEYRYGAMELEPDVQEMVLNLYQKSIDSHSERLFSLEKRKNNLDPGIQLPYLDQLINKEKDQISSCQQIITAVEELRRRKQQQEEAERQKALANASPASLWLCAFYLLFIISGLVFIFGDS